MDEPLQLYLHQVTQMLKMGKIFILTYFTRSFYIYSVYFLISRYGPFLPGILKVPFNDADALEKVISSDPTIAALVLYYIYVCTNL